MQLLDSRFMRRYVIPGAVFQSVMIGGGYGTGREIVEYFTSFGFTGGLLAMGVTFVAMTVVLGLTFELSRLCRVYDYRNFFKLLLGRAWFLFEILIVLQFLLVLAVLASAAGNILRDHFGLPYAVGLLVMLAVVGVLTYFGRELVMKALTFWSLFLYLVFFAFLLAAVSAGVVPPLDVLLAQDVVGGWHWSGLKYAMYNVAAVPLLLYVARDFEKRSEALVSGAVGAVIAIVPALLFLVCFAGRYPAILEEPIPAFALMAELGATVLLVVYSVMLFGTFIETGAGMLQGINERLDAWLVERRGTGLARGAHAMLGMSSIAVAALLSAFGITALIARGYGTMAWGFCAVYLLPLLTIGLWRIARGDGGRPAASSAEALETP
jgi:uncharacterized membrane protein YkvI